MYCLHFYSLIKDGKEQIILSGFISWCYTSICILDVFCIQKDTVESKILFTEGRVNLTWYYWFLYWFWGQNKVSRSLSQLFVFPFVKAFWQPCQSFSSIYRLLQFFLLKWFSRNCCNNKRVKHSMPWLPAVSKTSL